MKGSILDPHEDGYPESVLDLEMPPVLTVSGSLRAERVVAIVGSRSAPDAARDFAHTLAYHLAAAGIVVVSGGAVGIDAAAHAGAMKRGATWCVAPCGRGQVFPPDNKALFDAIAVSESSRMIWPFPKGTAKDEFTPRFRNGVLVALSSVVIVIQAKLSSGSINAASWARELRRPLYVVPGTPWSFEFLGSTSLLASGATPLWSIEQLFRDLALPPPDLSDKAASISGTLPLRVPIRTNKRRAVSPRKPVSESLFSGAETEDETRVLSVLSKAPLHQETVIEKCGLGASATLTALLTLSLRDVVVEAPDGFFRRNNAR